MNHRQQNLAILVVVGITPDGTHEVLAVEPMVPGIALRCPEGQSTNVLERLNREIRRRSRVASPFPIMASYLRLITCYLIEYTEDWSTGRSYIIATNIEDQAEALSKVA